MSIVVLLLFCCTQVGHADEPEQKWEPTTPHIVEAVLIVEAIIGVNSYLATLNPQVYGGACVILFPLGYVNGVQTKTSDITNWVGLASAEALAIYNITLDKNKVSDSEIFLNNFIGWHLTVGIMAITGYFAGDFNQKKNIAIDYVPNRYGGRLLLSYRF